MLLVQPDKRALQVAVKCDRGCSLQVKVALQRLGKDRRATAIEGRQLMALESLLATREPAGLHHDLRRCALRMRVRWLAGWDGASCTFLKNNAGIVTAKAKRV
jgi:hypothetical protein